MSKQNSHIDDFEIQKKEEEHQKKLEQALVKAHTVKEHELTVDYINSKRDELHNVGKKLKEKFIGIDGVIDQLLNIVQTWYIMPQILTRPLIVNLWGMTGVGKTDLIRTFVKEIEYMDRFVEIQLNQNKDNWLYDSVQEVLDYSRVELDQPCVLLLDEIQRFRTVSVDGSDMHPKAYNDIWTLLSDGKFSGSYGDKDRLFRMAFGDLEYRDQYEEEGETAVENNKEVAEPQVPQVTKKKKKRKASFNMSYYEALRLKKVLRAKESVAEILKWDKYEKKNRILEALNNAELLEGQSYPQMLIVIAGNLDEAYEMAGDTDDSEIDADVLHAHSLNISMVDIKDVLRRRFRPEQIARFGNMHIVYPSLDSASYRSIIDKKLNELSESVKDVSGVHVSFDDSVQDFVYRNGVFPAQGVRPVFSTISTVIENIVPFFVMKAKEIESHEIQVRYDNIDRSLHCSFMDVAHTSDESVEVGGALDELRKKCTPDQKSIVAVHESGHAVVYAVLFGVVPTQIVCNSTRTSDYGFMGIHSFLESREITQSLLSAFLAGLVAEEYVFGRDYACSSSSDIKFATEKAASYIRRKGLHDRVSYTMAPDNSYNVNYDHDDTDYQVESFLVEAKDRAYDIIKEHEDFLRDLARSLFEKGRLTRDEFREIAECHNIDASIGDPEKMITHKYHEYFKRFISKKNMVED